MLHKREVDGREVCSSQIREELEKNVASEVQVKRFTFAGNFRAPKRKEHSSSRVQTDRFKQEGRIVTRPPRLRFPQQE